jgi:hypothetical protein
MASTAASASNGLLSSPAVLRAPRKSLLNDVVIDYGPPEILGRLFLRCDTQLRECGVRVALASFDELADVNRANRDSWLPLSPVFDPAFGGVSQDNAMALIGYNATGEPVVAHACRLYKIPGTLKDEIESLRFFYPEPDRHRQDGETVTITAPTASVKTGEVVYTGAVWYRPDCRKQGLLRFTSPIIRALAYTRWDTDFVFSFMVRENVDNGLPVRGRFPHVEWHAYLTNTPLARGQTLDEALVWTNAQEMREQFAEAAGTPRENWSLAQSRQMGKYG